MRTMGEIADDPDLLAIYRERVLRPRLDQARALVRRARARRAAKGPAGRLGGDAGGRSGVPLLPRLLADAEVDLPADPAGDLMKLILHGIARSK